MPRRRLNAADPTDPLRSRPRLRRRPREPHLPTVSRDTIRVTTDKGAVEYTDATFQIVFDERLLCVFGTREDGDAYIAALYNADAWLSVTTVPAAPVLVPHPEEPTLPL